MNRLPYYFFAFALNILCICPIYAASQPKKKHYIGVMEHKKPITDKNGVRSTTMITVYSLDGKYHAKIQMPAGTLTQQLVFQADQAKKLHNLICGINATTTPSSPAQSSSK